VQFGFAHRALDPQEQPVIEVARIVKPVFVEDVIPPWKRTAPV
jgi:hypothetical protein